MDRSIQYAQYRPNFDSAYNTSSHHIRQPTVYVPISSSASFPSHTNRSISPSLRSSNPKFNIDLYEPNGYHSESDDYSAPSSPVIIHHHPVYPPPSPHPPSSSQTISKLRQLNDELCHTLAQCELTNQSQPSPSQYHVHHYPIPQDTYYRSRSPSESSSSSSSAESEPVTEKRNARITYKVRVPRRPNSLSKVDQLLMSTSDVYSRDDPMTIDLYPTRDQDFVKQIRNRPDNQSPWLADNTPSRRSSYSDAGTYRPPRTPRAPYYNDKPITPKSRLASGKERPPSSLTRSYVRPDSAPNPLRRSAVVFSSTGPGWRPNGSIKHPKFIGSNAPPSKPKPAPHEPTWNPAGAAKKTKHVRAFDPYSESPKKAQEPVWQPALKAPPKKTSKYFEPTLKPELIVPIKKQTEPLIQRKTVPFEKRIPSADPKLKTRIAKAESKVKSAWEPTTTVQESKPPIPRPVKKTTTVIPPKLKAKNVPSQPTVPVKKIIPAPPTTTDTGRSSLFDVPTKPMFQSTPVNQSVVDENDDSAADLFEKDSQISEPPKKPEVPPRIEKPSTELPKIPVTQPDKGTKSTIKDDANDVRDKNRTPSPAFDGDDEEALNNLSLPPSPIPPARKVTSPKPDNRDDVSVVDDEGAISPNANGDDEHSFEIDKSTDDAAKSNINASKTDDVIPAPTPPRKPPKADLKTPPRRKEPSPSPPPESPDPNSSPPLSNTKKSGPYLPSTPPPATTGVTNSVDDFFD